MSELIVEWKMSLERRFAQKQEVKLEQLWQRQTEPEKKKLN